MLNSWIELLRRTELTHGISTCAISETLHSLVKIRPASPASILSRRQFWSRCSVIHPQWWADPSTKSPYCEFVFVDGIAFASKWNCCQVLSRATDGNLCMYFGYARQDSVWSEHAWCMLDGKIIETESRREMYFGAELNNHELEIIQERCGRSDLRERRSARVFTIDGHRRILVPFDRSIHGDTIGCERDPLTNLPKNGFVS